MGSYEFNNVFGLFLNCDNIAIAPNTTNTLVNINTVNQNLTSEHFVANDALLSYPGIEIDSFTHKLEVTGSATNGTNTLKIAIADVGDRVFRDVNR